MVMNVPYTNILYQQTHESDCSVISMYMRPRIIFFKLTNGWSETITLAWLADAYISVSQFGSTKWFDKTVAFLVSVQLMLKIMLITLPVHTKFLTILLIYRETHVQTIINWTIWDAATYER